MLLGASVEVNGEVHHSSDVTEYIDQVRAYQILPSNALTDAGSDNPT